MRIYRFCSRRYSKLPLTVLLISIILGPIQFPQITTSSGSVYNGFFYLVLPLAFVALNTVTSGRGSRKRIFLGLLFLGLLLGVLTQLNARSAFGLYEDWQYRKSGMIDHSRVAEDLSGFPVLVDITDSDLAAYAQADGDDIVFTDQYGTKLNHEIEFFNSTNGHLIGWVRFPVLSSIVDTSFYMYYGNPNTENQQNPEGVWDSTFIAVHHLKETSGNATDSTANAKDAISTRVTTYGVQGKIGSAMEFAASSDHIRLPQVCSIESQFTFSAWIYARSGARYFISQWYNSQGAFLQIYGSSLEFYVNSKLVRKPISLDEWHYVVATFDGTLAKLYLDDDLPSTIDTSSLSWPSQSMYFGNRYDLARIFKGVIDEIRVSSVDRSVSWIATEFNNQQDPSRFCRIQSDNAPVISNAWPQEGASHVNLNPTLSVTIADPNEDLMTIAFRSNSSGTWQELGAYVGGSGIYTQGTSDMTGFNVTYYWEVCAFDNESGMWTNATYHFTTLLVLELKWVANVPAGGDNQLHPAIGDINGDGKMEVVMSGNNVVVALNGEDGNELWRYSPAVHRSITLADLTNDGVPEILAAQGEGLGRDRLFALFGNGTLFWRSAVLTGDYLCDFPVTAYDIDGDGYPTIYFATEDQNGIDGYSGRLIALNHKGEVLAETQVFHPCTGGPTVADYDFDGTFEVYMGDRNYEIGEGMRSWWASNLTSRWSQPGILCSSQVPVLVDTNNDGKLEVIALDVPNHGFEILNASNGAPIQKRLISGLPSHATPTVHDVDRDGNLEIILSISRQDNPQNFVIYDIGRGRIDANISLATYDSWCAWPPTVGDVNGDGFMEIIAAIGTEPGEGDSTKDFPILIYDAPAPNEYRLIAEIWASGAGCMTFARVQDVDNDGLNEVIVAGINGKVLAYDTMAPTTIPRPRTEAQYYSEYRRGAAEYVELPGPPQPLLRDEHPLEGSAKASPNPTLSIRVHDFQQDEIAITFKTNASGAWEDIGTYNGGSGVYTQPTTSMDEHDKTYFWAVNAIDSKGHSTFKVYEFTTMPWWNKDWHYRKLITVDHAKVTSDLSDFPILIETTDLDLSSHAQNDGKDIVFTDYSGNKLDHEIEAYDSVAGYIVAWVKIPTLSSTEDTLLHMYYGNAYCGNQEEPEAVWGSDFLAVHHLEEEYSNVVDSTSMHRDAIFTRVTGYQAPGQIGYAMEFDGVDDYIELPQVLSTETQFTFSAWIFAKSGSRYFISQWYNSRGAFLQIYPTSTGSRVEFYINSKLVQRSITLNAWHYVVATFDGTTANLYIDAGPPSSAATSSLSWPSQSMYFGDRYDHTRQFKGFMDEIRISNTPRSAVWITTEYNNQLGPSSFCIFGNQEYSNTPPTASEPLITPANPLTTDDLVAAYAFQDLDGDPESNSQIRWYEDGILQTDLNDTMIIPAPLTKKGETWYFTVTPSDGMDFGSTVISPSVTILNSPPVITSYTPESAIPTVNEGESLTFTHTSYDSDDDPLLYTWLVDSIEVGYTENWTYSPGYDVAGNHNVTLTVSDGQEIVTHEWSVIVMSANQAPTIDSWDPYLDEVVISEGESQAFSIACHDPEGETLIVQWFVNDTLAGAGDTFTFEATFDDAGSYNITVLVTDPSLAEAIHAWTIEVLNVNRSPVIETYAPENLLPEINEGEDLYFAHTSYDPDGDTLYCSWILDGVVVATTQDFTYEPSYEEAGLHNVTLVVSDGQLEASIQWSVTVTDVNGPPSAPVLEITPTQPTTTDDLTCTITSPSIDPDGDIVAYTYEWYLDDVLQPDLADSTTVQHELTSKGQTWTCIVTPFDGTDYGPPTEAYVTIQNAFPQIDTYTPESLSPSLNEGESMAFTHTSSDPDGDILLYSWILDDLVVAATQAFFYSPSFDEAGFRNLTLVVSDGQKETSIQWNVTVIDINRVPSAPVIEITPLEPSTEDDLTCVITSPSTDPDGDTVTYVYEWYLNDTLQPNMANVVSHELTNKGETWKCVVTPFDTKDYGSPAEAQVTIQNTSPQIDTFAPSDPVISVNEGENLEFTHTSSDLDSDTLTYEWLLDLVSQSASQNWTYTPDFYSAGDHNVTLVVSDGESAVSQYWLVSVANVNQAPNIDSHYSENDPTIREGQAQKFNVTGSDLDGDVLTIEWWVDGALVKTDTGSSDSFYEFEAGKGSAGTHTVTVVVEDYETQTSYQWTLTITEQPIPLKTIPPWPPIHGVL